MMLHTTDAATAAAAAGVTARLLLLLASINPGEFKLHCRLDKQSLLSLLKK